MENNKFFFDIVACNLVKVKPVTVSYGESFSTFFSSVFAKEYQKTGYTQKCFMLSRLRTNADE